MSDMMLFLICVKIKINFGYKNSHLDVTICRILKVS